MNPEIERLFKAAADVPASEQAAFLQDQTSDPELRREVLSLLLHDGLAESLFDGAVQREASSIVSFKELEEGRSVGPYRILNLVGRGGMGAVYVAERADGHFEQRVALKVIQSSQPGQVLLDRFQRERSILAHLNHPYIASLHDGGQTSS